MNNTARYWEDFEVGTRYSTSTRTISNSDLDKFCQLVGYDVPLFVQETADSHNEFEGRICPSHLIMSVATAMTGSLFSAALIALLGLENGRFLAPVYPGDSLSTEVEVVKKRLSSKPGRGIVVFRDHVFNQNKEKVFQVDKVTLLKLREFV